MNQGVPSPSDNQQQREYPRPTPQEARISKGAIAWSIICIIAQLLLIVVYIDPLTSLNRAASANVGMIIFGVALSCCAMAGYILLLTKRRTGFSIICVCVGITAVINLFSGGAFLSILFSLANPIITWLLIKKDWPAWR